MKRFWKWATTPNLSPLEFVGYTLWGAFLAGFFGLT